MSGLSGTMLHLVDSLELSRPSPASIHPRNDNSDDDNERDKKKKNDDVYDHRDNFS